MTELEQTIRKQSLEYAESKGLVLNPDQKLLSAVLKGLARNKSEKGKFYCPCRPLVGKPAEDDKKVCPCIWHLDEITRDGHCKCKLFYSKQAAVKSR